MRVPDAQDHYGRRALWRTRGDTMDMLYAVVLNLFDSKAEGPYWPEIYFLWYLLEIARNGNAYMRIKPKPKCSQFRWIIYLSNKIVKNTKMETRCFGIYINLYAILTEL